MGKMHQSALGVMLKNNNNKTAVQYNLRISERQILGKIFGPVNIDSVWRIRNNMETDNLTEGADIVKCEVSIIIWVWNLENYQPDNKKIAHIYK